MDSRGYNNRDASTYFYNSQLGDNALWAQLLTASDQMRQRLTLALSEFFVVSTNGYVGNLWANYLSASYWDLLAANVYGNYRNLLEAVTLNPAMGYYLNTRGNLKEDSTGRQPDENYAREVMQLFSIGLYQLNQDGSIKTDLSGNRLETYTQSDITNLAHVFTGWDLDNSGTTYVDVSNRYTHIADTGFTNKPMINTPANHSTLQVIFLGTTVPANTDARSALGMALDTLFNHPNVGPFFARQMIQRLVSSNPSPAYISRVASVFNNNGAGVRGDLKAVWTAILTDIEALNPSGSATSGKLREPMVRLIQLARTLGVASTDGAFNLNDLSDMATEIAQSPLRSPSVFNFFRPGYVPPNTALGTAELTAPEFQLVNESSVAGYLNFLAGFLKSGVRNVVIDYANASAQALVTNTQSLLDFMNLRLAANQLSSASLTTIKTALDAQNVTTGSTATQKNDLIALAAYLVMASAEYLIQK